MKIKISDETHEGLEELAEEIGFWDEETNEPSVPLLLTAVAELTVSKLGKLLGDENLLPDGDYK